MINTNSLLPPSYFFVKIRKNKIATFCLILVVFLVFLLFWTQLNFTQSGTIKVWDRNNILLYESAGEIGKKTPVSYEDLPKHLIDAVISAEDSTFWQNPGIDVKAILRSAMLNLRAKKVVSGASTITQQLARKSIIAPNQLPSKNIFRKIREALIALRITAVYSKQEIISMYFNQMYFGNLSYGIQAAAATYFDKNVSQLSLAESAFLVGLLASPDSRNPFIRFEAAKSEQAHVLDLMVKHGHLQKEQAEEAKQELLVLSPKKTTIKAPHFVSYVLQELDSLGISNHQGLNIYTTLDYPIYTLSENLATLWVDRLQAEHDLSNAALVLLDNTTGEILNMLGGIDYFDATNSGQINMATALRQPGSTLKPVTYAAAFMQGYTPATLIYDVKKVYQTKKGEGFTPNNYDGRYHGLVLAREALASSLNLPAVEMLNRIGISSFLTLAKDMGISTFTQEDRYDLSITLGGGEVKLLELTNLFATFARQGEYVQPYAIEKISTDNGTTLFTHQSHQGTQVFGANGKQIAYLISDILSDPKARIPGFSEKNPLVLSHPAAVKTGTTTDWHDNWTVGYTPSYTVGVWVGNNDNHPMRAITGVVGAAPIWNQFFEEFLKGKPTEQFIQPEGIKEVEVCALSGKLYDGRCPEILTEVFADGTVPTEFSNLHKKVLIDTRNGLLANKTCPSTYVLEKLFIDYPPEVNTWAIQNHLEVIPNQVSDLCGTEQQAPGATFLDITYPKNKTVFETAPEIVSNERIGFEVATSATITKIIWRLDDTILGESSTFPFNISWKPQLGNHSLVATGLTATNQMIQSKPVSFTVVGYKTNTSD